MCASGPVNTRSVWEFQSEAEPSHAASSPRWLWLDRPLRLCFITGDRRFGHHRLTQNNLFHELITASRIDWTPESSHWVSFCRAAAAGRAAREETVHDISLKSHEFLTWRVFVCVWGGGGEEKSLWEDLVYWVSIIPVYFELIMIGNLLVKLAGRFIFYIFYFNATDKLSSLFFFFFFYISHKPFLQKRSFQFRQISQGASSFKVGCPVVITDNAVDPGWW